MWLKSDGFLEMVKEWWISYSVMGTPNFAFTQKLRNLKRDISKWNREVYGKLENQRNKALEELGFLEQIVEHGVHTSEEKLKAISRKLDLKQIATAEEISWRQKSRCLPSAHLDNLSTLNTKEWNALELPFSELEVLNALKSCAPDKAPGPDGFTMAFYQKAWTFIKEDIMNTFSFFHQNCQMMRSANASFIALIPKKKGALELRDFKPISLRKHLQTGNQGFQAGNDPNIAVIVSHLLYADDTLVFCGANSQQVQHLNLNLMVFESISGLHINMLKSKVYLVNKVFNLNELADILSCSTGTLPTTYLGLPLGTKFKSTDIWNRRTTWVGAWKFISSLQEEFFQKVSYKAYNGAHKSFWLDQWLGNTTLKNDFRRLYQIASNREATIAQYREGNIRNPTFRRNLQDWELNDLLLLLDSDEILWCSFGAGTYTVKDFYRLVCSQNSQIELWPWKHIWKTRQPLKVTCFTWTALSEVSLTQDNLGKRCIHNETVNHLFLHCPVSASIWLFFLSMFGLHWVMPGRIKDAYNSWISWRVGKSIKRIWTTMIPAVIFCSIWTERNHRHFDGISTPRSFLKATCLETLFNWHTLSPVNNVNYFLDFVSSLTLS
ncbi:unnamed protein product [Withania somnifera]